MKKSLRLLVIEDSEDDALLLLRELKRGGYEVVYERVDTVQAMTASLDKGEWDIIISDHNMPNFSALEALSLLQKREQDIPFIIVSGSMGEDVAVGAMKAGAHDFILKDNLARLVPAVGRELREAEGRRERLWAQETLAKNEQRLAAAQRVAHLGSWEWDLITDSLAWSEELYRVFEVHPGEFTPTFKDVLDRIHPEDRAIVRDAIDNALKNRQPFNCHYRITSFKDHVRLIHALAQVVRDDMDRPIRMLGTAQDITELRELEETLRKRNELYDLVIRATNDTVYDWDMTKDTIWWNENFQTLFGYAPNEQHNSPSWWKEHIHPEDSDQVMADVKATLESGRTLWSGEYRFLCANGTYAYILNRGFVLYDEERKPVRWIGSMIDITSRKKLEEQLLQAQKMEALGQLVGGISHDFNNFLSIILGYGDFISGALHNNASIDSLSEDIEEIKNAATRAASLTRQLLVFSRRQVLQPVTLNLNESVVGMEKMLSRLVGEDIKLMTKLDENAGCIRADPGQIEQIILNLIVNARDAMPKGGDITIETKNVLLDESTPFVDSFTSQPGTFVMLSASDTGCGMDETTKSRIFEPFFTTKEKGKGTGLGLSTVYGVVKQSGGYISVESGVSSGTTFRIYFPLVKGKMEVDNTRKPLSDLAKASETVLVVEDERKIREMIRRFLQAKTYRVLEATSGEDALSILGAHQGPIHLIITDVVMQGMSGFELAERLKPEQPNTKIIYISGYTDHAVFKNEIPKNQSNFIMKPFTSEVLTAKVREVLDDLNKEETVV